MGSQVIILIVVLTIGVTSAIDLNHDLCNEDKLIDKVYMLLPNNFSGSIRMSYGKNSSKYDEWICKYPRYGINYTYKISSYVDTYINKLNNLLGCCYVYNSPEHKWKIISVKRLPQISNKKYKYIKEITKFGLFSSVYIKLDLSGYNIGPGINNKINFYKNNSGKLEPTNDIKILVIKDFSVLYNYVTMNIEFYVKIDDYLDLSRKYTIEFHLRRSILDNPLLGEANYTDTYCDDIYNRTKFPNSITTTKILKNTTYETLVRCSIKTPYQGYYLVDHTLPIVLIKKIREPPSVPPSIPPPLKGESTDRTLYTVLPLAALAVIIIIITVHFIRKHRRRHVTQHKKDQDRRVKYSVPGPSTDTSV